MAVQQIVSIKPVRHSASKVPVYKYEYACGHSFVGDLRRWSMGQLCQPMGAKCGDCK